MSYDDKFIPIGGFLIVLKPEFALREYETREIYKRNQKIISENRDNFQKFDITKYRGTSRFPLDSYVEKERKVIERFKQNGIDINANEEAKIWMNYAIPDPEGVYYNHTVLHNYDDVMEIYEMLERPAEWEVIHIRRKEYNVNNHTLGFDIGFGGGKFSLIADTIITPMWHPVVDEDCDEVKGELLMLNDHLLFDTPEQAKMFREYYKSKPWAETDYDSVLGGFNVLQVDTVRI